MSKNPVRKWFTIAVVLAFPGVVLLFNTNSYHADKNNLNTAYLVVGIALCLSALYCLYKANKLGNPGKPKV